MQYIEKNSFLYNIIMTFDILLLARLTIKNQVLPNSPPSLPLLPMHRTN